MRKLVRPRRQQNGATSRRALAVRVLAGATLLSLATGCTSSNGPAFSNLPPALGGLPADAPARPAAEQSGYPAVHDMPPPRTAATLTPDQVKAVEAEIAFARERQKQQARGATQPQVEER
jgi:hypothetical protein